MPASWSWRPHPDGADLLKQYRQAAGYLLRILRGEPAGELPVQAPTGFELALTLATARP